MDVMTGNLEKMIGRFKCAPAKSAAALLPIVKTLAVLASETPRVHHRDLKPTNLLYLDSEDELYLADFGCAFLGEGDRVTPDHRALGAWAYRPPEYSGGRVETVDEKGDVFSLGKLLWAMINGEPGTTFPGPIWYLPEYDLASICSDDDGVGQAMYIIGTRFYPDSQGGLRFFAAFGPMHEEYRSPRLTVRALDGGMTVTVEGLKADAEVSQYTSSTLADFLARAVEAWSQEGSDRGN